MKRHLVIEWSDARARCGRRVPEDKREKSPDRCDCRLCLRKMLHFARFDAERCEARLKVLGPRVKATIDRA